MSSISFVRFVMPILSSLTSTLSRPTYVHPLYQKKKKRSQIFAHINICHKVFLLYFGICYLFLSDRTSQICPWIFEETVVFKTNSDRPVELVEPGTCNLPNPVSPISVCNLAPVLPYRTHRFSRKSMNINKPMEKPDFFWGVHGRRSDGGMVLVPTCSGKVTGEPPLLRSVYLDVIENSKRRIISSLISKWLNGLAFHQWCCQSSRLPTPILPSQQGVLAFHLVQLLHKSHGLPLWTPMLPSS